MRLGPDHYEIHSVSRMSRIFYKIWWLIATAAQRVDFYWINSKLGKATRTPPNPLSRVDEQTSHCVSEARAHDYDRYLCALFAPRDARPALLALTAFNLEVARVAEAVSEPMLGEIRLQWWRDAITDLYDGIRRDHPVVRALAPAIERGLLSRQRFERIFETRIADLGGDAPADLAALVALARATAGELHHLWREALGETGDSTTRAVEHSGAAFALVGLMRAMPFHAARGRLYLPSDLVRDAGADVNDVLAGRFTPALASVVMSVLDCAEHHLREARILRRQVLRRALPALLPATLAGMYLRRLRRVGGNPFAEGLTISPLRKQLGLTAASVLRVDSRIARVNV